MACSLSDLLGQANDRFRLISYKLLHDDLGQAAQFVNRAGWDPVERGSFVVGQAGRSSLVGSMGGCRLPFVVPDLPIN